jgi:hypothetical protein
VTGAGGGLPRAAAKGGHMPAGTDSFIGPQVLTFAIPVGTLALVCLWGFFQRRSTR